ncbi:photolyase [Saccharomyces cerevisiae RM11-1a]|uniref:Photolyase n=1 Tax=Saccharomyces cerevisiae (strain RM11-1a) TaxID=285006 RepID=B3LK40_YEAS1|nr:Phr1p [Saccharomyces cerevisiae YJM1527]EDV10943.1 photolyase [Saccharomyces cerevisiae RM11-1a]CAI4819921.1 ATM_1a_G0053400.mRNA.1.CDS.1 [Saccharomyces cerevisiae]CAI7368752.1 ATM_1a_G0053400.mRNA.1.CDS.1 [Saccharomyces cerevisiae]
MKRTVISSSNAYASKRSRLDIEHDFEQYHSLNKKYYPRPITRTGANQFNNKSRAKPMEIVEKLQKKQKTSFENVSTVMHWFRNDLRLYDNVGLYKSVALFQQLRQKNAKAKLYAVYVINEDDWRAHMDSGWKLMFIMGALKNLQQSLAELHIPLLLWEFHTPKSTLSNSKEFVEFFKEKCMNVSSGTGTIITANIEYQTDELYRDIRLLENEDHRLQLKYYHDSCIVTPGLITTDRGTNYSVFTPWYKKWVLYVNNYKKSTSEICHLHIIEPLKYNETFELKPFQYSLPDEFLQYIPKSKWCLPDVSEEAALSRLKDFLGTKSSKYNNEKDMLYLGGTSGLSVYITTGRISTRLIVNQAFQSCNGQIMSKALKDNSSTQNFIKEVAWRDFYRHCMCNWPYTSMGMPYRLDTLDIKWENNPVAFEKWCTGNTGIPIVDAIMRKLLYTGYINNRSRMITASFLSKNLLIDWRWGERWFMKHLIDGDSSSNVGGWGFCSSTGIDAQPYFRVFNMDIQAKKYDPQMIFVKQWVPELISSENKRPENYPKPLVDLKHSRERALKVYKDAM